MRTDRENHGRSNHPANNAGIVVAGAAVILTLSGCMEALHPQQSQLLPPNVPTREAETIPSAIPTLTGEGGSEGTLNSSKSNNWQEYVSPIMVEECIGPIIITTENTTLTDFGLEEKIVRIKMTDGNIVQTIDRRVTDPNPARFMQGGCIIEYGLDVARAKKENELYPTVIWRVVDKESRIQKGIVAQKPPKDRIKDSRLIDNRRASIELSFDHLKA